LTTFGKKGFMAGIELLADKKSKLLFDPRRAWRDPEQEVGQISD